MTIKRHTEAARQIRPSHHARLEPAVRGDQLVTVSVGPGGQAVALWTSPAASDALTARTVSPGGASFPDSRAERPVSARITVHDPDLISAVTLDDLQVAYPFVQPLPHGRFLVVGARCRWRAEGPERNAVIYDGDGQSIGEGTLGDGVQEVLTTASGMIWVGYFDEGVFGNFGWGGPGPKPIGAAGIVQFSSELKPAWRYPEDAEGGEIDDAYTLNVDGESAWCCYYTDFPVVRINDGRVDTWRNPVSGPRAVIASGTRCAMLGGYQADADRLAVGTLTDGVFELEHTAALALPRHGDVRRCRLVGRGPTLHIFAEHDWYQLRITDLPN